MKKKLIIPFVILYYHCLATAQMVPWDSTYRPDIFQPRVELFKSFSHSRKDIVFLGNSITFWGDLSELLGSSRYKNRGIPGDTSFGILERLDEVIQGRPAKVFILIGINDLARDFPDSVTIANYRRIIRRIQAGSPSTKIYFQTMLPTNDSFGKLEKHYNKEDRILAINAALKAMTTYEKVTVIDLYPHFSNAVGKLNKEYTLL